MTDADSSFNPLDLLGEMTSDDPSRRQSAAADLKLWFQLSNREIASTIDGVVTSDPRLILAHQNPDVPFRILSRTEQREILGRLNADATDGHADIGSVLWIASAASPALAVETVTQLISLYDETWASSTQHQALYALEVILAGLGEDELSPESASAIRKFYALCKLSTPPPDNDLLARVIGLVEQ